MIKLDLSMNDHVFAMQNWWRKLEESGELDEIFMPNMHSLAQFYEEFSPPTQGFFDFDEKGIFVFISMRRLLGGVCQTFWVRDDHRHSPSVFKNWIKVLNAYFEFYPLILGITKKPDILEAHTKLGYDVNQVIPDLFGDKPGWILYLHRSKFKYLKSPSDEYRTTVGAGNTSPDRNGTSPVTSI